MMERSLGIAITSVVLHCLLLCPVLSTATLAAEDSPVQQTETLIAQWLGLERQREVITSDWRQQQPVLEQQLVLLQRESEELQSLLDSSADQQSEVEERRLQLLQEQAVMEAQQEAVEQSLTEAVIGINRIHGQLPPPLAEAWSLNVSRLRDTSLSSSERLQQVVNMLTQLHDFQQKITVSEAVMQLADGSDYLVDQVYLGISHGWYISRDGRFAGTGAPGANGWQWQVTEDGDFINRMITIAQGRQAAQLMGIPVRLNRAGGDQ